MCYNEVTALVGRKGGSAMSDQIQQIAARLRELRELREMSQEEAAAKLGHTLEEYRDFEDGRADIPVSLLHAAAELFGVDMTELLTGRAPRLRSFCLTRKGEGIKVERYKGYDFQSLAYNFIHRSVEPLLVTVDPSPISLYLSSFCVKVLIASWIWLPRT